MNKELMHRVTGIIFVVLGVLGMLGLGDPEFENSFLTTFMVAVGAVILLCIGFACLKASMTIEERAEYFDSNTFSNLKG